jgi:electron transport complex protein RnfA
MGAATTFVLTVAAGASYLIDRYLLVPNGLEYLRTLSFIIVIAAIVQLTETGDTEDQPGAAPGAGHLPAADHHQLRGARRPAAQRQPARYNFFESLLFGFGSAVGFTLALILFAGIRERLEAADVPVHFRGTAIAMITAGLMSLAFMGFAGLDKYK